MAEPGATPSHQFFAGFNAFFSPTWKKTRVEQVSLKVFHLWCILGQELLEEGCGYPQCRLLFAAENNGQNRSLYI